MPMTETGFYILFSLQEERHGYHVIQYLKKITDNEIIISAGTLYGTLSKMEKDQLIRFTREEEKRKYYQGLPVTSASLIFPAVCLLRHFLTVEMTYSIYAWVMFITAWAFVINFKVRKPGLKGILVMLVVGILICAGLIML